MNEKIKDIYINILTLIIEKQLSVGDRIPPEVELAKKVNTNRMNAHRAVKELEKRGILESKRRHGTFIRKNLDMNEIEKIKSGINKNCQVVYSFDEFARSYWDQSTLSRLEKFLVDKGYSVLFKEINAKWDKKLLKELLTQADQEGSTALIMLPGAKENVDVIKENNGLFSGSRLPVFIFSHYNLSLLNWFPAHLINIDHYSQGLMAGRYLKECGHCEIIYLTSQSRLDMNSWAKLRYQGLETEFCRNDDSGSNEIEICEDGKNLCKKIKASSEQAVIVADSDRTAAEFIDLAGTSSLAPLEDYQILSFDNRYEYRGYNLTTIGNSLENTGEVIGRLVYDKSGLTDFKDKICLRLASDLFERQTMRKISIQKENLIRK